MITWQQYLKLREASNMGLSQPGVADYAGEVGKGVAKAAIGAIPFVGSLTELGETVWNIINLYRRGNDVRGYIAKMIDMRDKSPGVPANAFDLEDNLSQRLSDIAKKEIVDKVMVKLDAILQQGSNVPANLANQQAYEYLMQLAQKGQAATQSAPPAQTPAPAQQPQQQPRKLSRKARRRAAAKAAGGVV